MTDRAESPGPTTVRSLVDQLKATEPATRREAVTKLATLATEHPGYVAWGKEPIRNCLADPDPKVRATACRILGSLGANEARNQLRDLRLDTSVTVSEAAGEALTQLDKTDPVTPVAPPESEPQNQDSEPTTPSKPASGSNVGSEYQECERAGQTPAQSQPTTDAGESQTQQHTADTVPSSIDDSTAASQYVETSDVSADTPSVSSPSIEDNDEVTPTTSENTTEHSRRKVSQPTETRQATQTQPISVDYQVPKYQIPTGWWAPIGYSIILLLFLVPYFPGFNTLFSFVFPLLFPVLFAGPPVLSAVNIIRGGSLSSSVAIGVIPGIWGLASGVVQWYVRVAFTNWDNMLYDKPTLSEYIWIDSILLFFSIGLVGAIVGITIGIGYKRFFEVL